MVAVGGRPEVGGEAPFWESLGEALGAAVDRAYERWELGFQPEMGLPGLVSGAPAESPPEPSPARLDTEGISPHFSESAYLEEGEEGEQLPLVWGDKEARRERRGVHARLARLLLFMESGVDGLVAKAIGMKWRAEVEKCPGSVRRHKVCGKLSFIPHKCDFALCPWCQHRRSDKARRKLDRVVGLLQEPKLLTLSPPNLAELTSGAVGALGGVFTKLTRRAVFKEVRGGIRSIETTLGRNGWNLHLHALMDSPWIAHYPQTDIKPVGGEWVFRADNGFGRSGWVPVVPEGGFVGWAVVKKHPGLAREFTAVCQKYPELRSLRLDFNLDNPDHWYFIDIRQADSYGAVSEVVKYIAKGSEIVKGGAAAVVDYLKAIKGRRMIQPFGNLYGVDVEGEEEEEPPEAPGECPYEDCPSPAKHEWEFVGFGPSDWALERDSRTGSYRVVGELPRDGPG